MFLSIGLLILLALIFGPSLWVKFVMKRYSKEKPEMPGTGGELAKHLIERFTLKDVKVEVTELGDHYDPVEKKVRLLRERGGRGCGGKEEKEFIESTAMRHRRGG